MTQLTEIDWCGFRTKSHAADVMDSLHSCFLVPTYLRIEATGRGWNGYKESRRLEYLGKPVGLVAFGGEQMKDWCQVNLTGDCMEHISGDASETLTQLVEDHDGQFKRVDIALTTADGSMNISRLEAAHSAGLFRTGGRNPKMNTIKSTCERDGQTRYIGCRDQPKFLRGYDKGLQLAKEAGLRLAHHSRSKVAPEIVSIDGVPVTDIFRTELELKPEPHLFPIDVLMNRDSYFAGAYPFCAQLVQANPETFRLTAERHATLCMDKALMECRRQYGDVLYTALAVHGGDFMAVWDKVVGFKHSESLIRAGVLHAVVA